ncbi:MAG: pilus assembly protein TadG-related protein [Hyphomicrobium sp.]
MIANSKVNRWFDSLTAGTGGGVSILFGVSLIVLAGAVGVAMDSSRAHRASNALQGALDAGVLAAAKLEPGSELEQIVSVATASARFNLETEPELRAGAKLEFKQEGGVVRGIAHYEMETTLTRVLGINSLKLTLNSAATSASTGVELMLVLDVSGSMGSRGKIDAARQASVELIDLIYGNAETRPDTYVGITPFSGRVNINGYGRAWMTGAAPSSAASKLCTDLRSTGTEENDELPSIEPFPYFSGSTNVCPDFEAVGLSTHKTPVREAVMALEPGHGTSTNKGMVWGWRMISPKWKGMWGNPDLPLSRAESPGKIVVMMTDGQNHPGQSGDPYTTAEADAQLLRECTAMKEEGIRIFTVALDMGSALTSLYQQCATSPSNHYDAADGTELQRVFNEIGGIISRGHVRLVD